jgi:hypothetical protein
MIEMCEKLLVLKLDSLWKHVGKKKAIIAMASVLMGEYYTLKTNQHVFNECLVCGKGGDNLRYI